MIAVKSGRTDLTNTLLGGGYDVHVDVQENVSILFLLCPTVCSSGRIGACSSHLHFEHYLGRERVKTVEAVQWMVEGEGRAGVEA